MKPFLEFLKESKQLDEDKHAYLKKYEAEAGVEDIVQRFWTDVRKRAKAPENDIEYWYKKPFSALRDFVDQFDMRNKSDRRTAATAKKAEDSGAVKIGDAGEYEAWYIPTHEAARQIGRFYNGRSASWCVSTDNSEFFENTYRKSEFVFLVRKQPARDKFDKLAVEFIDFGNGDIVIWDLDNHEHDPDESQELADLTDQAYILWKKSGKSKKASLMKKELKLDLEGNLKCAGFGIEQLPDFTGKGVIDTIDCSDNKLTSLKGTPKRVQHLNANNNQISTLVGSPEQVKALYLVNNKLTTLEGCPQKLGVIVASRNQLETLLGIPPAVERFNFKDNRLTTLRMAPGKVDPSFISKVRDSLSGNKLTSKQILDYETFLRKPDPWLMDEFGHYLPED